MQKLREEEKKENLENDNISDIDSIDNNMENESKKDLTKKKGEKNANFTLKNFYEKIKEQKKQFLNFFKMDYETLFNLINGEFE